MSISKSTFVLLLFILVLCDRIGSGTSLIGVGGIGMDMAANFARACEDFLPLLDEGGYWGEGAGGCTNLAVCRFDQEVAIVVRLWE
jgi:hypothetical protein